jgi:hypothetical protein
MADSRIERLIDRADWQRKADKEDALLEQIAAAEQAVYANVCRHCNRELTAANPQAPNDISRWPVCVECSEQRR